MIVRQVTEIAHVSSISKYNIWYRKLSVQAGQYIGISNVLVLEGSIAHSSRY